MHALSYLCENVPGVATKEDTFLGGVRRQRRTQQRGRGAGNLETAVAKDAQDDRPVGARFLHRQECMHSCQRIHVTIVGA